MLTITSKQPGFRRCGIAHPAAPVDYPDERFSKEEIAVLQAEPMLVVTVKEDDAQGEPQGKKGGKQEKKTAPEILDRDK